MKQVFAPGQSGQTPARFASAGMVSYRVVFGAGAVGTATFEVNIDGDWHPVDAAFTTTMSVVKTSDSSALDYRWNVSNTGGSGNITVWHN